jgi:hypothetical protein
MTMYQKDSLNALEALRHAQVIAFAPFIFQGCRLLRDKGVLQWLKDHKKGSTMDEVAEACGLSNYGAKVLLEAGLGAYVVVRSDEGLWNIARAGQYLLDDPMTRVNFDFANDVCYEGLFQLDKAIDTGKPAGLKTFGEWPTIYEGLMRLPPKALESWLSFDHFYSDNSFPQALREVFSLKPAKLLDVGGNTGKWALACLRHDADVRVTIADLPGQLAKAQINMDAAGMGSRFTGHPMDLLDPAQPLPAGHDAIWMSQFLDCFSEEQVVTILKRVREALAPGGSAWIMETVWDRQEHEAGALCLQMTSLYFTAMANGNSKMFNWADLERLVASSGMRVESIKDGLGWGHSLVRCVRA